MNVAAEDLHVGVLSDKDSISASEARSAECIGNLEVPKDDILGPTNIERVAIQRPSDSSPGGSRNNSYGHCTVEGHVLVTRPGRNDRAGSNRTNGIQCLVDTCVGPARRGRTGYGNCSSVRH